MIAELRDGLLVTVIPMISESAAARELLREEVLPQIQPLVTKITAPSPHPPDTTR